MEGKVEVLSVAARSVWAKSLDEQGGWLPLWQHMDDSADVAVHLFDQWLPPHLVDRLANDFGGDVDVARVALAFLAGIHDLGKATPAFAVQDSMLAQRMRDRGLWMPATKVEVPDRHLAHHSVAGHHLLVNWLVERGWPRSAARAWGVVLGGHHGVPPDALAEQQARPIEVPQLYGTEAWDAVRGELAVRVATRTGACSHLDEWSAIRLSQPFQVLAVALVIVADWIASNADLFPFHTEVLPAVRDESRRPRRALARLRLPSPWRAPRTMLSSHDMFSSRFSLPLGAKPRPIQEAAVEIARELRDPGIAIIEAPMGEGKTEAALAAAEVIAGHTGAGGLFVALPTQATTDAMFARVVGWLDKMNAGVPDTGGAITLSHGKARFNQLFQGLGAAGRIRDVGRDERSSDVQHSVTVHSWLTGRKKAQLATFVVGTIDQLLFAGLKARHLMLRHLGLAGKVVVLDEIHAYDAYMNSYLTKVLTWLGAYRVPVVALSATLPGKQRRELVDAYEAGRARGIDAGDSARLAGDLEYPVLTWTDAGGVHTRVVESSRRRTTVHVEALSPVEDPAVSVLRERLRDGGVALVVCNTVRRVLDQADLIEREFPGEVTIAHSRFIVADRLRNDAALLDRFGPPGRAVDRPFRHVVVASQVVEQSLDVDFDLLITDLAPIDLVLQRMGRLHRHERDRPGPLRTARTFIAATDFSEEPPALERGATRYVYGAHALLRSAAVLAPRFGGTVELPDDIAPLVQEAYGEDWDGPVEWRDAMEAAEAEWREMTRCREEEARFFQIAGPGKPGTPIIGWLAADVGEADESSQGQGQVRDGIPSLEAILVQVDETGRWYTPRWLAAPDADVTIPRGETPTDELAEVLTSCAIRLPLELSDAESAEELRQGTPSAWESSPLVHRLPALVVDGDGWAAVNGRRVRYTAQRGLEVMQRGH